MTQKLINEIFSFLKALKLATNDQLVSNIGSAVSLICQHTFLKLLLGLDLCFGQPIDKELLNLITQDVEKWKFENDAKV